MSSKWWWSQQDRERLNEELASWECKHDPQMGLTEAAEAVFLGHEAVQLSCEEVCCDLEAQLAQEHSELAGQRVSVTSSCRGHWSCRPTEETSWRHAAGGQQQVPSKPQKKKGAGGSVSPEPAGLPAPTSSPDLLAVPN